MEHAVNGCFIRVFILNVTALKALAGSVNLDTKFAVLSAAFALDKMNQLYNLIPQHRSSRNSDSKKELAGG